MTITYLGKEVLSVKNFKNVRVTEIDKETMGMKTLTFDVSDRVSWQLIRYVEQTITL